MAELDFLPDAEGNSIGGLLAHLAGAEVGYQAATFHGRELNDEEHTEWDAALALGELARQEIKGRELAHYVNRLDQVRATTLAELQRRDDAWLDQEGTFGNGRRINNYFKWFQCTEPRGQPPRSNSSAAPSCDQEPLREESRTSA